MTIATGYFAVASGYADLGYKLVSIAKKRPWFLNSGLQLHELPCLFPSESILKLKDNPSDYEPRYIKEILGKTTPQKVYEELQKICGDDKDGKVVLLCYEAPGKFCHRNIVARWIEEGLGIKVEKDSIGPHLKQSWDDYLKNFLSLLPKVSQAIDQRTIFCDACRIFSLSIRGTVTLDEKEKEAIENEYQTYVEKYGKDGMQKIAILLSYVVEALERKRQDFLGHVQEHIEATNKHFGAFYTPDSVSTFMARIVMPDYAKNPGKIVRMNDPSCGAGALLIAGVEAYIESGGRQCDILVYGEDIDQTACCIFYVQASLLGYAAVVTRRDTLSLKVYEGPWYTPCYFAHGMPMRLIAERMAKGESTSEEDNKTTEEKPLDEPPKVDDTINVRKLVQGELPF